MEQPTNGHGHRTADARPSHSFEPPPPHEPTAFEAYGAPTPLVAVIRHLPAKDAFGRSIRGMLGHVPNAPGFEEIIRANWGGGSYELVGTFEGKPKRVQVEIPGDPITDGAQAAPVVQAQGFDPYGGGYGFTQPGMGMPVGPGPYGMPPGYPPPQWPYQQWPQQGGLWNFGAGAGREEIDRIRAELKDEKQAWATERRELQAEVARLNKELRDAHDKAKDEERKRELAQLEARLGGGAKGQDSAAAVFQSYAGLMQSASKQQTEVLQTLLAAKADPIALVGEVMKLMPQQNAIAQVKEIAAAAAVIGDLASGRAPADDDSWKGVLKSGLDALGTLASARAGAQAAEPVTPEVIYHQQQPVAPAGHHAAHHAAPPGLPPSPALVPPPPPPAAPSPAPQAQNPPEDDMDPDEVVALLTSIHTAMRSGASPEQGADAFRGTARNLGIEEDAVEMIRSTPFEEFVGTLKVSIPMIKHQGARTLVIELIQMLETKDGRAWGRAFQARFQPPAS